MISFKDKVVWITGASSGIGEALAIEFARKQAKLVISSRRKDELERVKAVCLKHCTSCLVIPMDLSSATSIQEAVSMFKKEAGTADVLIHNGGVSQRSLVEDTPIEIDRKIFEINYFGAITLTKLLIKDMISNGGGSIAVISSVSGKFGFPLRSAYAATKHALLGFFESLMLELYQKNIFVTLVCPGRIKTDISLNAIIKDGSSYGKMDQGQEKGISAEICAKKIVKAMEKKKKEIYIGRGEIFLVWLKRHIPCLFYYLVKKVNPT